MLAEFVTKIVALSEPVVHNVGGVPYCTEKLIQVKPHIPTCETVVVRTLGGLVEFVANHPGQDSFVHVEAPGLVSYRSGLFGEKQRDVHCQAKLFDLGKFPFRQFIDKEQFFAEFPAHFVPDETVVAVARLVGDIRHEVTREDMDDGITQQVAVADGVKLRREKIPNPVILRPYRTFPEIQQPASSYVLRVRCEEGEKPAVALFPVESGTWQLEAIGSIKKFLVDAFTPDVLVVG